MVVRAICLALALAAVGCTSPVRTTSPELAAASKDKDISGMRDVLEDLIDAEQDQEADREYAYEQSARVADDGSAGWALARAEIVGRYAESKGLKALWLIKEIESLALQSIERDADFSGAAARRMLGTLYVLAGDHTRATCFWGTPTPRSSICASLMSIENNFAPARGVCSIGSLAMSVGSKRRAAERADREQCDMASRATGESLSPAPSRTGGVPSQDNPPRGTGALRRGHRARRESALGSAREVGSRLCAGLGRT
jgi:hypothetical protein